MSGSEHETPTLREIHGVVDDRLRRSRQRYTQGRRRLIEVLAHARRPVGINEIIAAGDGLSQSSVYRNLQVLEQAGAVRRIITPHQEGGRYELGEDLTAHHHHLVCRECGAVEDFHPSRTVERALERSITEARQRGAFDADVHRLELIGTCGSCA